MTNVTATHPVPTIHRHLPEFRRRSHSGYSCRVRPTAERTATHC